MFKLAIRVLIVATLLCTGGGCANSHIAAVERFNALRDRGDLEAACALVESDARVWYENPTGLGSPWNPGAGAWSHWDQYFHTSKKLVGSYQLDGDWVFGIFSESNDFYLLTEKTWSRVLLGWRVNERGRINGMLVAGVGNAADRFDEFKTWARQHEPQELGYLMPGGRLDPSGDRAERFREILERWRAAAGLPDLTSATKPQ